MQVIRGRCILVPCSDECRWYVSRPNCNPSWVMTQDFSRQDKYTASVLTSATPCLRATRLKSRSVISYHYRWKVLARLATLQSCWMHIVAGKFKVERSKYDSGKVEVFLSEFLFKWQIVVFNSILAIPLLATRCQKTFTMNGMFGRVVVSAVVIVR